MGKQIFSITCATCKARLAVRSESAIGAILECPRCQSMVQVTPPPGWTPAALPIAAQADTTTPPPLDRVATDLPTLKLELTETTLLGTLLRQKWLLGGVASLASLVAVVGLLWFMFSRPEPEPVDVETKISVSATENPETVTERPATAVAEEEADQSPASPELQSGYVEPDSTPKEPIAQEPVGTPFVAQPPSAEPGEFTQPRAAVPLLGIDHKPPIKVKKTRPAYVDVAARLAEPIAGIELNEIPLGKAVNLIAALGALPITLDVDAMTLLGVAPRDPVSVQLGATTVGEALQAVVTQKGLAVAVENGQVLITAPSEYRETLRTVRYTVADLTGDDEAAATELAALVQRLVAPESWQRLGGRGAIESTPSALVVAQTGDVHRGVLIFCEKLRKARQKPLRSRENPARFALITRVDQGQKMLARTVTANFHEPTPLAKILAFLAEATGSDILIDRIALAAAETSDRVEASFTVKSLALGTALEKLLRPLGLTYRIVDPKTIEVTTHEAAEQRLELEFYPVGSRLSNQNSPLTSGEGQGVRAAALAERLKARVAPSTWSDVGGLGEAYFDPPSKCLIVLQSQPAQATIERLLARKGEGRGGKGE